MAQNSNSRNYYREKVMLRDITAGTCAGVTVTLVGHPFDTLKVRLQTQPQNPKLYNGLIDCFKKTIQWEGLKGLYKGVTSPLVGQMAFRANMFLSHAEAKRFLSNNSTRPLTTIDFYLAGGFAWFCGTFFECPIDVFKSQLQVQIIKSKTIPGYKAPFTSLFAAARDTIKNYPLSGPFTGFLPHLIRNIFGGAMHLGTFEVMRNYFAERRGVPLSSVRSWEVMTAGGCGGVLFWGLMFPVDVIKSAMQTDSLDKKNKKYSNMRDCATKLFKEGGIKRFYQGYTPCMLRAIPANAIMLYTTTFIIQKIHIEPPANTKIIPDPVQEQDDAALYCD